MVTATDQADDIDGGLLHALKQRKSDARQREITVRLPGGTAGARRRREVPTRRVRAESQPTRRRRAKAPPLARFPGKRHPWRSATAYRA